MKLQVLVDNNTYINRYFYGEPGVSYYLEDEGLKLLFDAGYSDLFIKNAKKLDIDLNQVSKILISHGHDDHTRGLKYFVEQYDSRQVEIIAHPEAFKEKQADGLSIGPPFSEDQLRERAKLVLTKDPSKISENLYFLGEIPLIHKFENQIPDSKRLVGNQWEDDFITDDSAVVYKSPNGLYIITGCSHSGICNIIECAKEVCGDNRVKGVLGGFHLFEVDARLNKTIEYFVKNNIKELYPCHCVSFKVKAEIHKAIPIFEVGVGLELNW